MTRSSRARLALPAALAGCLTLFPVLPAHEGVDDQIAEVSARIAAAPGGPSAAPLYLKRGELHRLVSEDRAAESDYDAARRLDPELAAVDLCLAELRLARGRARESRVLLDRYTARRPEDPDGWIARARASAALGEPLVAAGDYTRAIALFHPPRDPQPEHYLERARALAAAGLSHLDEAIAGLDEGLERLGRPVTLELAAIDLEQRAGRYDAALERLDRAEAFSPRREFWHLRRGRLLERAGRTAEARQAYLQSLDEIGALSPARRRTKAVVDLQAELAAALRRVGPLSPETGDHGR